MGCNVERLTCLPHENKATPLHQQELCRPTRRSLPNSNIHLQSGFHHMHTLPHVCLFLYSSLHPEPALHVLYWSLITWSFSTLASASQILGMWCLIQNHNHLHCGVRVTGDHYSGSKGLVLHHCCGYLACNGVVSGKFDTLVFMYYVYFKKMWTACMQLSWWSNTGTTYPKWVLS